MADQNAMLAGYRSGDLQFIQDMPVDEVEQQLFALLGKKSFSLNTPIVDKKEPMTVVFERTEQPIIHGTGVLDKYLIKK